MEICSGIMKSIRFVFDNASSCQYLQEPANIYCEPYSLVNTSTLSTKQSLLRVKPLFLPL